MPKKAAESKCRFIFITGGVVSSLGKGIAAASLAALLQTRGYRVRLRKLDPYLNVDPGTMSPYQHGEVFVTDDGTETDLDLGHYERFTGVAGRRSDSVTTGRIYSELLAAERRGDFLGATIQVIPHVTDGIKKFILNEIDDLDFLLCEIGGTVGDIESLPFLEAIRQLSNDVGRDRTMYIHLTLLPYIAAAGELKTKPTQHSVKDLLQNGIQPDMIICRSEKEVPQAALSKVAQFCNVRKECVIPAQDMKTIYELPIYFHIHGMDNEVLRYFHLDYSDTPDLSRWKQVVERTRLPRGQVNIAIVGKYTHLHDAYKSLMEALTHGGIANQVKVNLRWVESTTFESLPEGQEANVPELKDVHGILVPGGFGERGAQGKVRAVRYARENKIPYFGICFGLQMAVIEAARNLLNLSGASTTEFGPCEHPVVAMMTEWEKDGHVEQRDEKADKGATMRLGAYPCTLTDNSLVKSIYGMKEISERHRHRYEVNTNYRKQLESVGVVFSGMSPDGKLPEIIERKDHPWFVGVQFHPELKSKPFEPHPLFASFIAAAKQHAQSVSPSLLE